MSQPFGEETGHFLLVGVIGSCVALATFSFMWFGHGGDRLLHSAACIMAFTSCLSYFATFTGAGIVVKASETPSRDIFWARYLDAFLTACITAFCMCHLMKTSFVAAASIFSHIILCVLALSVGAITIAPFKFWWWGAGCTFFALVAMQIRAELVTARKTAASTAGFAGTMSVFAFIWSAVFVAVWLLGQEGAAVMSRPLETCLLVLADLALKGGLFAYVLSAVESGSEEASGKELQAGLLASSRFSTECI